MFSLVVERDQWHEIGKDEEDKMWKSFDLFCNKVVDSGLHRQKWTEKKYGIKVKKKAKRKVITVHLYKPVETAHTTKVKL